MEGQLGRGQISRGVENDSPTLADDTYMDRVRAMLKLEELIQEFRYASCSPRSKVCDAQQRRRLLLDSSSSTIFPHRMIYTQASKTAAGEPKEILTEAG